MIKKFSTSSNNISSSVEFLLSGAQKRRAAALTCVKSVNSELGADTRLVAIK